MIALGLALLARCGTVDTADGGVDGGSDVVGGDASDVTDATPADNWTACGVP